MMSGVVIGRIVHFVLNELAVRRIMEQREKLKTHGNLPKVGDHVAMIITAAYDTPSSPNQNGEVNGQCILDGNDSLWVTSTQYDEYKNFGTWHWIEKN